MNLAAKLALMRAARTEHGDQETFALVTRTGNENVTVTWDELAEAMEVLRELVGVDDLPPGWVSMSVNTKPLDICGYCGALAEYHQEERHWHADHTDDCPVAHARRLLDGAG
jgi:hypothetical protein